MINIFKDSGEYFEKVLEIKSNHYGSRFKWEKHEPQPRFSETEKNSVLMSKFENLFAI